MQCLYRLYWLTKNRQIEASLSCESALIWSLKQAARHRSLSSKVVLNLCIRVILLCENHSLFELRSHELLPVPIHNWALSIPSYAYAPRELESLATELRSQWLSGVLAGTILRINPNWTLSVIYPEGHDCIILTSPTRHRGLWFLHGNSSPPDESMPHILYKLANDSSCFYICTNSFEYK